MLKLALCILTIWIIIVIINHAITKSKTFNDRYKKTAKIISGITGLILTILPIIIPIILPYILPPPVVYPTDYDVVHPGPVEIRMEAETIFEVEIYYTMNGRDPASKEIDSNDVHKYTEPFLIYESTSFTAKSKLGSFWSSTTVPAPYIKVADTEEEFIDVIDIKPSGPDEITVGSEGLLKASVFPDNATDKKVNWNSLTPKIASINNSGVIFALSSGTATFEVSSNSGEIKAEISVEIVAPATPPSPSHSINRGEEKTTPKPSPTQDSPPPPTPDVSLLPSQEPYVPVSFASINSRDAAINLELGASTWLTASYSPLNATNANIYWSTDNPKVAAITSEGFLRATGVGSTYVNVNIGGVWDSRYVVVAEPIVDIDYVYIDEDYIVLDEYGDSYYPDLRIEPQNAFYDSINWSSDDPDIASVDYDGEIFPHRAGSTTIYANVHGANGYFRTLVEVDVNADTLSQDIEHFYIDEGAIELEAYGSSYYPRLVIEPEYAVIREIRWDSDDPNIASVDSDGEIHPHEPGTTTIYAKVLGKNVIREAPLTVYVRESASPPSIGVDYLTFTDDVIYLEPYGNSYYPNLLIFPMDAAVFDITWSSDDPNVAIVDYDGEIFPKEPGFTQIWAEVSSVNGTWGTAVSVVVAEA